MGDEWRDAVSAKLLPVLKPLAYIDTDDATRRVVKTDWLSGLIVVYAICTESQRFATDLDLNRWNIDQHVLHMQAMHSLRGMPWPEYFSGTTLDDGGRLIAVHTNDNFDASRLLHPDLHRLLSGTLGSPFLAGVPERSTLVTCSRHAQIRSQMARTVREDCLRSAHSISPKLFLVTPDGIQTTD
jgi:uncharacterized protein YtpQ (UPF0354 family)